jgi:HAD superfamily hydrolase (TIGR01509 family)
MNAEKAFGSLKLVILDCDGVMFDSLRSNVAYYNSALERMGEPPIDEEATRLCHVYSTPQFFAHLFASEPEKAREAERIAYAMDYRPFLEFMDPEPDLYGVLDTLKERYGLALATNRGKSMQPLLERFALADYFEVVSTILKVPHPKPAPDLLLYCLERTGVPPGEAVYVGDMENDRIASEKSGIPFVLKGDNIQHPLRIEALADLPRFLEVL